ncbi:uncharacterized protein LOC132313810 [Cornus florida]|uniref:uncharacterized protein LOC132313810 n=1 Tax=Cornus florida TaxID=4283 RepID=UPI00289E5250|nr:uncharacterized protein LOC132313810 [Cornus florida]
MLQDFIQTKKEVKRFLKGFLMSLMIVCRRLVYLRYLPLMVIVPGAIDNEAIEEFWQSLIGCSNDPWLQMFTGTKISCSASSSSDHYGVIINIFRQFARGPKPFKMLKIWCLQEGIFDVIKKSWEVPIIGTPFHILLKKLKNVKAAIKAWNLNSFGNIKERVHKSKQALEDVQLSLLDNPTNDLFTKENQAKDEYHDALSSKEILYAQKSRIHWLKYNNRCSAFFYSKMKQHNQFNAITSVEDHTGQVKTQTDEIRKVFVDYYQGLFQENNTTCAFEATPKHILTLDDKLVVDAPITDEDIKAVVMNFKPDKAPCPDGFLASSFLTLIPKVGNAVKPKDYRPIALCNLSYKIISKILAARLALVLPNLVGLEQSVFIKGQKIQDAIIMGHEMLINTSISEGRLTLSNTALKANSICCHTFFADDLLITCKASVTNTRILTHIFKVFGDAAGLRINYQKSSVIFSKFARRKRLILNMLQCKEDVFPFKYLGLPLSSIGFRKFHCNALTDKISKKLSHWSTKLLSTVGKTELIKSVITPTCLYWCSVFQLPIAVINQIQKMCRDFVWGSRENINKLHLLSWDMMCRPKDEGGLGIRKLKDLQVTSQRVLAWDFLLSKDRLWISWFHHRYTTSSNFWNAIPKISHSILWKNMINVRETLLNAIHFSNGDG